MVEVKIKIDGKEYSLEEAREIYNELDNILGQKTKEYIPWPYREPYYPKQPWYEYPQWVTDRTTIPTYTTTSDGPAPSGYEETYG